MLDGESGLGLLSLIDPSTTVPFPLQDTFIPYQGVNVSAAVVRDGDARVPYSRIAGFVGTPLWGKRAYPVAALGSLAIVRVDHVLWVFCLRKFMYLRVLHEFKGGSPDGGQSIVCLVSESALFARCGKDMRLWEF